MENKLTVEVTERTKVKQEAVVEVINQVIVYRTMDDYGCVIAHTNLGDIVLWDENSTPSYSEIGQWTDDDVAARLEEII